jgi:hypothetical protein
MTTAANKIDQIGDTPPMSMITCLLSLLIVLVLTLITKFVNQVSLLIYVLNIKTSISSELYNADTGKIPV